MGKEYEKEYMHIHIDTCIHICMCNWITLMYTWNLHRIVNQLYFQKKSIRLGTWGKWGRQKSCSSLKMNQTFCQFRVCPHYISANWWCSLMTLDSWTGEAQGDSAPSFLFRLSLLNAFFHLTQVMLTWSLTSHQEAFILTGRQIILHSEGPSC